MEHKIITNIFAEPQICPKHHIDLVYRIENDELILKCEWCDYTLVPFNCENCKKIIGS